MSIFRVDGCHFYEGGALLNSFTNSQSLYQLVVTSTHSRKLSFLIQDATIQ